MRKKNIGALIPVRLQSERLPGKAIMPILGRPAIYHLLDRVSTSRFIEKGNVVVCTTEDPSDGKLAELVEGYGASVFRGSKDDIIKRFYDAMHHFNFDAVIQIDGDDILSETIYMDLTMEKLLEDSSLDIVTCSGLPLGLGTKSFTMSAMENVYKHYKTEANDTGFIYFFTKSGLCNHLELKPTSSKHINDEARLTLDYKEDFELFSTVIGELHRDDRVFGIEDIVALFNKRPELLKINGSLNEEYWQRTKEKVKLVYIDKNGESQDVQI